MSQENIWRRVKIHYRILTQPDVPAVTMLNLANNVYNDYNVSIDLMPGSAIRLVNEAPNHLKIRKVRPFAEFGKDPTSEEAELYDYARNYDNIKVIPGEVVVYFITDTDPKCYGMVYRKFNKASIIITKIAQPYTLAHEIGHMLDIVKHSSDKNNLMHEDTIFERKPYLNEDQISILKTSKMLWT